MDKPLVTVGVSFYNTVSTLIDLLKSIYSQTFTDWELILVDDGSTDNPMDILRRIKDRRVILISDGQNKGMAKRYNEITQIAKGKYIARFDADDICDPTRFEKQVNFLDSNPFVDVVSSDMYSLDHAENFKGLCHIPEKHEEIFSDPVKRVNFYHGPMMGRREWFAKFPYNEKYRVAVDYALYISSHLKSRYASLPEPLYYYRVYDTHSFKKYYNTTISYIDIIRKGVFEGVSSCKKQKEMLTRYARIGVYGLSELLSFNDYLISKREFVPIVPEEIERCTKVIEQIRNVKIPGIDD